MVDNHPRPEGGARGGGVVIYHNFHGYRASTVLYPALQSDWSTIRYGVIPWTYMYLVTLLATRNGPQLLHIPRGNLIGPRSVAM